MIFKVPSNPNHSMILNPGADSVVSPDTAAQITPRHSTMKRELLPFTQS